MTDAYRQTQFLDVIDRDEADRRFRAHLDLSPLEPEETPLADSLSRVLAVDVISPVDVPGFDRSNVDGFAVRAADTFGATEDSPISLRLTGEVIPTGVMPAREIAAGTASAIATGGMLPRGADAIVMIEHTSVYSDRLTLTRPVAPGGNVSFTGSDIGLGETVMRVGEVLTSRETGVLAAIGIDRVSVVRRPRVAILSTGDELVPPGQPIRPGQIYDSNATVLADAVRELGGEPVPLGIVPDDRDRLRRALLDAIECDVVLLSGGTSKGAGDVSYRVVHEVGEPGIVAHGVALKPGKPLCLAVVRREPRPVPVAVLPGFPTSAVFTFHEFLAPVIRSLAGRPVEASGTVTATLAQRVNSERGRTEYLLVNLVHTSGDSIRPEPEASARAEAGLVGQVSNLSGQVENLSHKQLTASALADASGSGLIAFPMGKGSGSVTAFARADGFVTIDRQREYLEAGAEVTVRVIGAASRPADLVVIGSHCVGLDMVLGRLHGKGFRSKFLAVGSMGGVEAVRRGACDLAGVHLLDEASGEYNRAFVPPGAVLVPGYGRSQGVVFRRGDARFEGRPAAEAVRVACADPECLLANRNRGSGTRILIDRLLGSDRPAGYLAEAKSHSAVAAAVAQGRADWGVAIATVAADYGLGFLPLQEEHFDFLISADRLDRPAVRSFCDLLNDPDVLADLRRLGFAPSPR
jgi:putative molybdopterin biosynthesis protein